MSLIYDIRVYQLMALAFNNLTKDEIIELSNNNHPESELNKMTFDELELINEQITQILSDADVDHSLYEKLMNLRSYIVMVMWSE